MPWPHHSWCSFNHPHNRSRCRSRSPWCHRSNLQQVAAPRIRLNTQLSVLSRLRALDLASNMILRYTSDFCLTSVNLLRILSFYYIVHARDVVLKGASKQKFACFCIGSASIASCCRCDISFSALARPWFGFVVFALALCQIMLSVPYWV